MMLKNLQRFPRKNSMKHSMNFLKDLLRDILILKLIRYRKRKLLTQNQVASSLGYKSFTTIQKWEDGSSEPPLSILYQLCDIYEVNEALFAFGHMPLPPYIAAQRAPDAAAACRDRRCARCGRHGRHRHPVSRYRCRLQGGRFPCPADRGHAPRGGVRLGGGQCGLHGDCASA